jgi:hypothetical protein
MGRLVLVAAMALDLGTWWLVPPDVRAMAESNAFVPYVSPIALKIAAVLAILGLASRFTTRQPTAAYAIASWIALVGAVSNLGGLI